MPKSVASLFFAVFLEFSLLATGCTKKPDESSKPEFAFAPESVSELTIAQSDPGTGSSWTATFSKRGNEWLIDSAPGGATLLDRKADGGFIAHLVDTLKYLKTVEAAPSGPLSSYGLEPPRSAIRWRAGGKTLEVQFGDPGPNGQGRFARVPDRTVWIVAGATLGMLGTIESFDGMRRRTLTTLDADDFDEIAIESNGKQAFYAQRLNDGWANAKEKPYDDGLEDLLARILKFPVEEFVDDPVQAKAVRSALEGGAFPTLVLKGPRGAANRLTIGAVSGETYGYGDSRPDAPFRLQARAAKLLDKLARARAAR